MHVYTPYTIMCIIHNLTFKLPVIKAIIDDPQQSLHHDQRGSVESNATIKLCTFHDQRRFLLLLITGVKRSVVRLFFTNGHFSHHLIDLN